jgi:hypothetical protein
MAVKYIRIKFTKSKSVKRRSSLLGLMWPLMVEQRWSIVHIIDTILCNRNYCSSWYAHQTFIILMLIAKFETIYKSVRTRGFWHLCCIDQPQIQFGCITNTVYVTIWNTLSYMALFYVCAFTLTLAKYWMWRIYCNAFVNTQIST